MSRSFGGIRSTMRSPMRTWPSVIDSNPATMRRAVVFRRPKRTPASVLARGARVRELGPDAAVHHQRLPVDVSAQVARQEEDRGGDVGGLRNPPEGRVLDVPAASLL